MVKVDSTRGGMRGRWEVGGGETPENNSSNTVAMNNAAALNKVCIFGIHFFSKTSPPLDANVFSNALRKSSNLPTVRGNLSN